MPMKAGPFQAMDTAADVMESFCQKSTAKNYSPQVATAHSRDVKSLGCVPSKGFKKAT
jgi:hypothetical protein